GCRLGGRASRRRALDLRLDRRARRHRGALPAPSQPWPSRVGGARRALHLGRPDDRLLSPLPRRLLHYDDRVLELYPRARAERRRRPSSDRTGPPVARGTGPALAVEVEGRVVDAKAALASNRFGERRDGLLTEVLDRPAGGADQMVVMARLAPDVGR